MSKHIKKLEKENLSLKKKCDKYDQGAIQAIQEQGEAKDIVSKQQEKITKLEALCRLLQGERNRLKEQYEQSASISTTPVIETARSS